MHEQALNRKSDFGSITAKPFRIRQRKKVTTKTWTPKSVRTPLFGKRQVPRIRTPAGGGEKMKNATARIGAYYDAVIKEIAVRRHLYLRSGEAKTELKSAWRTRTALRTLTASKQRTTSRTIKLWLR